MEHYVSFGYWVQRRRKLLDMTQADLAGKVNCSLSMLRKIERDERRPSEQLAELLAEQLAIEESQRGLFLQMARGQYAPDLPDPNKIGGTLYQAQAEISQQEESVRWLISFLSVDKKKTFCLYEAPSAEAIREAARRAGIPADTIIEVGAEIVPRGQTNPFYKERFAEQ